jgi:hypothetical protein
MFARLPELALRKAGVAAQIDPAAHRHHLEKSAEPIDSERGAASA